VKRHDIDVVSLVFGLLFAAFVVWWLLDRVAALQVSGGWAIAVALLLAGAAGLASSLPRRQAGVEGLDTVGLETEKTDTGAVNLLKED
jgi:hypothetical protein